MKVKNGATQRCTGDGRFDMKKAALEPARQSKAPRPRGPVEEAKPRRAGELGGAAAGGWVEAATPGVTPRTGQRRKHPTFYFGQPKDSAACSLFGPTRTHASTGSRAVRCLSTAFDPHQGIDLEQSCRCANALQLGTGDRAGLAPVPWFVGKNNDVRLSRNEASQDLSS